LGGKRIYMGFNHHDLNNNNEIVIDIV